MKSVHLRPYRPEDEAALLELERLSPQGRGLVFEMRREKFAHRAQTFQHHLIYVAEQHSSVVGVGAVAKVPIRVEGQEVPANFFFDFRVHPGYRHQGIGAALYTNLQKLAWEQHETTINIATMKDNNVITKRALGRGGEIRWYRAFRYLAFSTYTADKDVAPEFPSAERISTGLLDTSPRSELMEITDLGSSSVWRTDRVYHLALEKIAAWYRPFVWLAGKSGRYRDIVPKVGSQVSFAMICHWSRFLPLEHLRERNVATGVVIMDDRDTAYDGLRKRSISDIPYLVTSNTDLGNGSVVLDVRCL